MQEPRYKIVLASRAPFVGGAEVSAERMALGLMEAGHEMLLVLGTRGAVWERYERAGLRCVHFPLPLTDRRHWWSYWLARRALRQLLRRERPHVIHSNDLPTHQIVSAAARGFGVPRICHHRFVYGGPTIDWLNKYGAEHHIFVSRTLQDELCARSPALERSRRTMIYDGLPVPPLPSSVERRQLRERLGLPLAKCLVIFAGQVVPIKGVEDLLHAWPHLPETVRAEAEFVLVGDDLQNRAEHRRAMEALAASLHCPARFMGFRENVQDFLLAADVSVVPSHVEPFGLATLEAMACGLPVVGSAVGGIQEVIVPEETGLLVPPRAPEQLAAALGRLLSDSALRDRLGRGGRERCRERFSPTQCVRAVLQVYKDEIQNIQSRTS